MHDAYGKAGHLANMHGSTKQYTCGLLGGHNDNALKHHLE